MALFLSFLMWISGMHWLPQATVPADPSKGTVHGLVMQASTNEPVSGAHVSLEPTTRGATITGVTDERGRFSFSNVAPGRYRVFAEHTGLVKAEYGQRNPQGSGVVVVVAPGQRLEGDGLIFRLNRPSAIAGFISNPVGEVIAAATVEAYGVRYSPAGKRLHLIQTALTDDLGSYRLFGLNPGSYYVSASYGDHASRPGRVVLTPNLSKPDDGYATLFYPNGVNPQTASILHVIAGSDINSINIGFADLPRVTIRGKTIAPDGTAGQAQLAFLPANIDPGLDVDYPIHVDGAGNFRITSVLPGSYVILAHGRTIDGHEVFSEPIDVGVAKEDVDLPTIPLFRGVEVSGRITTLDGFVSPESLRGLHVVFTRADGKPAIKPNGTTGNDATFQIHDVPIAEYDVSLSPVPPGTYVSGVPIGPSGATSQTLRLLPAQRGGQADVRVALNLSRGVIDGMVTDRKGDPVSRAQIVCIPERTFRRRPDYYLVSETDDTGHFEISGVPPFGYTVLAFERIEDGIYYDPEFIARFLARGELVSITKSSRKTVTLRLIPSDETDGANQ
jgi:hypothetical protein